MAKANLELVKALIERWSELTIENLDRDLERFDEVDPFTQFVLTAYWDRHGDHLMNIHRVHPKPDTPEAERSLFEKYYGHLLNLPATKVAADIEARLEWTKRRVAKQFERDIKASFNRHKISSPIEQIFLMEWRFAKLDEALSVRLLPQQPIETADGKFTVDFLVSHTDPARQDFRVVIELDGHDFHDRTKDQAARDKRRDRAILRAGHVVMRFTGSEVYRNAQRCVAEVAEYIRNQITATSP